MSKGILTLLSALVLCCAAWAGDETAGWSAKLANVIAAGMPRSSVQKFLTDNRFKVTYIPAKARLDAVLPDISSTAMVQNSLIVIVYFTPKDTVKKADIKIERMGI